MKAASVSLWGGLAGVVCAASAWAAGPATEAPSNSSSSTAQAMAKHLRTQYPATRFDSVKDAPLDGLFEVVMGKTVAYTDKAGRYFLFGHVWDMQQQRDLTADVKAQLQAGSRAGEARVDPALLPRAAALTLQAGPDVRPEQELHIFADPTCSACQQLERSLEQIKGMTIYVYPLPILGERSKQMTADIRCAAQPVQAWKAWMRSSQMPTSSTPPAGVQRACAQASQAVTQAAEALGIRGTPTLIRGDGRMTVGALDPQALAQWLALPPLGHSIATPADGR
ncbi:MAG: hypothetical protein C4K60_20345 [Ideonella sp. MAG2]|nr:MAG: hypothetical protein C4K60_20345 [Ideonella sp. MAG2]